MKKFFVQNCRGESVNVVLIGAAGFIGTNLAIKLAENDENILTLVDENERYFDSIRKLDLNNVFNIIANILTFNKYVIFLLNSLLIYIE